MGADDDTFVDTYDDRGEETSFHEIVQHSNAVSQRKPKNGLMEMV